MAILAVNPTRMELSNLKKKLTVARRGYKLLKDKCDELMRQFLLLTKENRSLRIEVEEGINRAYKSMVIARSVMKDEEVNSALMMPKQEIYIEKREKNVMSVLIPEFDVKFKTDNQSDMFSYGYAFTSGALDDAVNEYFNILPKMLKLAEVEKGCQLLSEEIEKTRRRVNALEHVIIPQYEETIKYIRMKLEENERGNITRLMKVKEMVLDKAHGYNKG